MESGSLISDYTTKLESSNSMILAQKQKYRSVEHDRKPRNKPTPHSLLQAKGREIKHSLLQGTFPIQGSNPGLLHCEQILYYLSQQGNPKVSYSMTKEARLPNIGKRVFQQMVLGKLDSCPSCVSDKRIYLQCRRHKRCGYNPWVRKIPWKRKW